MAPCPWGWSPWRETLDVELAASLEPAVLVETLNRVLPPGLKILEAVRLPKRLAPPRLEMAVYQVESPEPVFPATGRRDFSGPGRHFR